MIYNNVYLFFKTSEHRYKNIFLPKFEVILLLLFLLFFLAGCPPHPPETDENGTKPTTLVSQVPPSPNEVKPTTPVSQVLPSPNEVEKIISTKYPLSQMTPPSTNDRTEIYIQKSESMRGFAEDYKSAYVEIIEKIRTTRDLLERKCFAYGSHLESGNIPVSLEQATKPDFYDKGGRNDISGLLEGFQKIPDLPGTIIIFTTGVNNAEGYSKEERSIKSIVKMIKKGYYFSIILVESNYNGYMWSIKKAFRDGNGLYGTDKNNDGRISFDESSKFNITRPFCIFVFSTDKKKGRQIFDLFSNNVTGNLITFPKQSRPLRFVRDLEVVGDATIKDHKDNEGIIYFKMKKSGQMSGGISFVSNPEIGDKPDISLNVVNLNGEQVSENFLKNIKVNISPTEDKNFKFSLEISENPGVGWSKAGRVDFMEQLPDWIDRYHTDDDSVFTDDNMKKLYKFKNLIETIRDETKIYPDAYFYFIVNGG